VFDDKKFNFHEKLFLPQSRQQMLAVCREAANKLVSSCHPHFWSLGICQ